MAGLKCNFLGFIILILPSMTCWSSNKSEDSTFSVDMMNKLIVEHLNNDKKLEKEKVVGFVYDVDIDIKEKVRQVIYRTRIKDISQIARIDYYSLLDNKFISRSLYFFNSDGQLKYEALINEKDYPVYFMVKGNINILKNHEKNRCIKNYIMKDTYYDSDGMLSKIKEKTFHVDYEKKEATLIYKEYDKNNVVLKKRTAQYHFEEFLKFKPDDCWGDIA